MAMAVMWVPRTIIDGDGNVDVHVVVLSDGVAVPLAVHLRHLVGQSNFCCFYYNHDIDCEKVMDNRPATNGCMRVGFGAGDACVCVYMLASVCRRG